ncbi:MAG: class I SAM-dependent methyltransferase [Candidatus Rifleibacteriota bacterium]
MKQPDYGRYAKYYDYFELAGYEESDELNIFLNELFDLNKVETIVDFACGTGAQSVGLAKRGYRVTASDLSQEMLDLAAEKAARYKACKIDFFCCNMLEADLGKFDAAICIFNAIGHLSRKDCSKFFANAFKHLKKNGLFVFDIFNFEALAAGSFDDYCQMSKELLIDGQLINHARNCRLDAKKKKISIESRTRFQDGSHRPEEFVDRWDMQIYCVEELKSMLEKTGFSEIQFFGPTGTPFEPEKSDIILAICQK